jgi:hypothetical protein
MDSTLYSAKTAEYHVLVSLTEVFGWKKWPVRPVALFTAQQTNVPVAMRFVHRCLSGHYRFAARRLFGAPVNFAECPWLSSLFGERENGPQTSQQL